ncbi:MAG: transcriptional repressor LexA [Lachnospiraceae bacterium]|uniref:transcriptional repressor LexA n=1 Tax=Falcatimonas sp. MSJ-15 TaxID=2841515 RepID=UPI001C12623F|nr:transcriptional repressor LexA [Falcatimonas sp. MSJ-15]MBU5470295.1 transcriptional repressor LexA [Falcatimonas sp. MSJ-15]MEE0960659.1 transcriptional repressor LexA [Lachnospiraceae bacterium]
MRRTTMSKKQQEILDFIKAEILRKGYPPAVREICDAVNLKSTSSVHAHLETLERLGHIRRDPTKPRAIEILDESFNLERHPVRNVPIVGSVAAGTPILAEQNISEYFPVPADCLPPENVYMLNVKGESMINAGILDGDKVLVKQQATAQDGEIVVAMIDNEATVKRFYKENDHIRLQPENDLLDPIIVKDVEILGTVIGVFRLFK